MYNLILDLLVFLGIIISIVGSLITMKKAKKNLNLEKGLQELLVGDEKKKVFILSLLNPIWAGIIFYFGWRKVLPMKAKTANHMTFLALFIWIVASYIFNWPINLTV